MPQVQEVVLSFADGGMNAAMHPAALPPNAVARMTNCRIVNQVPATRFGVKFHPLAGESADFKNLPFQGAAFYNPALGLSQRTFQQDTDSIVVAAGGFKFQLFPDGPETYVSDVTGGKITGRDLMLVHFSQAENYLIANDGASDCWIWGGGSSPFFSTGYNIEDKEKSRLANGAQLGLYAHYRYLQVVDGNKINVGDILHKNSITTSKNILETTEQVYWATGQHFAAPSHMGDCRAAAILPLRNTLHGHADVVLHFRNGIISLKIDHYPRSEWANVALIKHLLLDTGALGPYAVAIYDGDQYFRSRHGVQSIRSAAATSDQEQNPQRPISGPVQTWLDTDYQAHLQYASVEKWMVQRRLLCTTGHWRGSSWRGARGMVVLNTEPIRNVSQGVMAWEGLWTLPAGRENITQFVNGTFKEEDRFFILGSAPQEGEYPFQNFLGELREDLKHDLLEDGSISRISCQLITRESTFGEKNTVKAFQDGRLILRDIKGEVDWGVWVKVDGKSKWIPWRIGKVCQTATGGLCSPIDPCCATDCPLDAELLEKKAGVRVINLGEVPQSARSARSLQFLIRWRGYIELEALRVRFSDQADTEDQLAPDQNLCVDEVVDCDYDDFEYSSTNRWELNHAERKH